MNTEPGDYPGPSGLRFEVCADYEALSRRAADLIVAAVRQNPSLLLCAATGASPTGLYARLAEEHREEPGLFGALRVLELDEWGGLSADAKGSCEAYLRRHLLGPLEIGTERYVGFRGEAPDPEAECRRVAARLAAWGPVDVAVLGIGRNGHVALNEPAEALLPHVHLAAIAPETLQHPMLEGGEAPQPYGFTLGMADLLQAKHLLLLVSGVAKRDVLHRLRAGGITAAFPASFLWLHPNALVLCDREAAGVR